jgi:hypothetical protein
VAGSGTACCNLVSLNLVSLNLVSLNLVSLNLVSLNLVSLASCRRLLLKTVRAAHILQGRSRLDQHD